MTDKFIPGTFPQLQRRPSRMVASGFDEGFAGDQATQGQSGPALLLEDGTYLLLEDDNFLLLE